MDQDDVGLLVEDLTNNIDELEESLAPLLNAALSATTSKLPLLDKAKLYVLATYAIESILFSSVRLHGVDAKAHPVFRELARVKEYFGKITAAETAGTKRNTTLGKEAAGRFVKAGLAGNEKYDRERAARREREKAGVKRKMQDFEGSAQWATQNRLGATAKRIRADDAQEQVPVVRVEESSEEDVPEQGESTAPEKARPGKNAAKRQRRLEAKIANQFPADIPGHLAATDKGPETTASSGAEAPTASGAIPKVEPRSNHDTSQALLQAPLPNTEEKKHKKKKRKSRGKIQ